MATHTVEIGSGSLRGSVLFGAKQDHYYNVPDGTTNVALKSEDNGCISINLGGGNGKATLDWTPGDKTARVHAWVNGTLWSANEVSWRVFATVRS